MPERKDKSAPFKFNLKASYIERFNGINVTVSVYDMTEGQEGNIGVEGIGTRPLSTNMNLISSLSHTVTGVIQ